MTCPRMVEIGERGQVVIARSEKVGKHGTPVTTAFQSNSAYNFCIWVSPNGIYLYRGNIYLLSVQNTILTRHCEFLFANSGCCIWRR